MTSRLLRGRGQGCLQNIVIRIIATVIVVPLACVCIFVPLAIAQNTAPGDNTGVILLAVSATLFAVLVFGIGAGIAGWILLSRARKLDEAFTPNGLKGSMYILSGRQYHGELNGRTVNVYFYRGPALDIYIKAPFKTRVSIGMKDRVGQALAGAAGHQPLPVPDPQLERFNFYPLDPQWCTALLGQPAARDAIVRLMAEGSSLELRYLIIAPEHIMLRLYQTNSNRITADAVRSWLNDLLMLIRAAEALPPPQVTATATSIEGGDPGKRQRLTLIVAAVAIAAFVIVPTCLAIATVALLFATQS